MAWKNGYYYRNKRVGSRVVTEYIGTGYAATLLHQLDEHARMKANHARNVWQAAVDADKALDAQLDEVTSLVNAYADMLMLASGYHQHKRLWRKQRR